MDQSRTKRINWIKVDQSGPKWTKVDQSRTKWCKGKKSDQKYTKVDQIG